MTERESLMDARDEDRLEAIYLALTWVPMSHYSVVQKQAEDALGEFITERDRAERKLEAARTGLEAAIGHTEELRMDTPEDERVRLEVLAVLRMAEKVSQ